MIKSYKQSKSYKYSKAVISGKIIASKFIIKQAERYLKDLDNPDYYFCLETHHRINTWFEKILYVPELRRCSELLPPHAFVLHQLYCIKHVDTGFRKHTKIYAQFARKQAKTYLAAGIGLFELIYGSDPFPEILTGANSRDQAMLCTKMMGRLIGSSPMLKSLVKKGSLRVFRRKDAVETIVYKTDDREGKIDAMSREEGDGGNPSATVIDELHEAKNLSLLETMESGQGLREQPLQIIITSCGHNKDGPCYSVLRKTALNILEGSLTDESFLPIVYELDNEKEWDNLDCLIKSNPMIPYFPTLKGYLKKRIKQAKNEGGETEVNIKIKNSGIWVDAAEVWIPSEIIDKNTYGITDEELLGRDCYAGLDLAKGIDLNACAFFFPNVREEMVTFINEDDEEEQELRPIHVIKMMYWIPHDKVKNHKDHVDYKKWINQGWMIQQPGDTAHLNDVTRDIIKEMKKYNMKIFGFDTRFAYSGPIPMLEEAGYVEILRPTGQTFNLGAAVSQCNEWYRRIQLDIMGNPVLKWNIANTIMKVGDMGDQYPSKGKSENRIDGVSAKVTAVCEYLRANVEIEGETFVLGI